MERRRVRSARDLSSLLHVQLSCCVPLQKPARMGHLPQEVTVLRTFLSKEFASSFKLDGGHGHTDRSVCVTGNRRPAATALTHNASQYIVCFIRGRV
jgi:hypothetical protein